MAITNDKISTHGSTKMVVITADDDVIRRITDTLNPHETAQIFELTDIMEHETNVNNYRTDLSLLNHPSNSNGTDNPTSRQVQSSSSMSHLIKVKTNKKCDLVCVICGGQAIANNYNAMTCGSCKIFFHRNGFESVEKKRCLKGDGTCLISHMIKRKCIRCRLQRCFAAGMTTDSFLTDEEKERRRKRRKNDSHRPLTEQPTVLPSISVIEEALSTMSNSVSSAIFDDIDSLLLDLDNNIVLDDQGNSDLQTLSIEESFCIQSLQSSFSDMFHSVSVSSEQCPHSTTNMHDRISIINEWTQIESADIFKLINVFRQINEFELLSNDDRFTLVKYNLFSLYMVRKCLIFDPVNESFFDTSDEDLQKGQRFLDVCPGSDQIKGQFMQWTYSMCQLTEHDSALLQLLLVVLLFSKGISMAENEPSLLDSAAVHRAQTRYTHLIWHYLMSKWDYERAVKQFVQLVNQIFRLQAMTKSFRSFLKTQISEPDTIEHIAPLMQTVLHISQTN